MYETHFHLRKRPFSAAPDSRLAYYSGSFTRSMIALERTIRHGAGIGLLTGASGLGKTLLCQTLAEKLADNPIPVLLLTASFQKPADLLQAILFELRRPYRHLSEQELRLELVAYGRELAGYNSGIAIIVDEAHLLPEPVLEELRSLTNFVCRSRPVFRVVLSGQTVLEEILTRSSLSALNQKLECHCCLDPLTQQESVSLLMTRVEKAGGDLLQMFQESAIEYAVIAADGNPRCLNHLCDLASLMAYQQDEPQVTVPLLKKALDELQTLPLHWVIPSDSISGNVKTASDPVAEIPVQRPAPPLAAQTAHAVESGVWEVGADLDEPTVAPAPVAAPNVEHRKLADIAVTTHSANLQDDEFEDGIEDAIAEQMAEIELDQVTVPKAAAVKTKDECSANTANHCTGECDNGCCQEELDASQSEFVDSVIELESDEKPSEMIPIIDNYAMLDARRKGQLSSIVGSTCVTQVTAQDHEIESRIAQSVIDLRAEIDSGLVYQDDDYVPHPDDFYSEPVDSLTAGTDVVELDDEVDDDF